MKDIRLEFNPSIFCLPLAFAWDYKSLMIGFFCFTLEIIWND